MSRLNKVNWNRFKELTTKLIEFRAKLSRVPIRAESWEEVIYAVLLYMEYEVSWEPTSHAKGVDLEIKINDGILKISAKGGKVTTNQRLSLSSYRLTRFRTLPEMLEFLNKNATELDVYLICAREEKPDIVRYHIFRILPNELVPEAALNPNNWEENEQGWRLRADVGFEANIIKKMSNQLWYSIPLNFSQLEQLAIVNISKRDIGSALLEILEALDKKKWQIRESLEPYSD
ncbi:hypothetical protein J7M23_04505 [Candidatus Sumerlaeota bacterium]|nr:hypothetical protein [Candidatus Sumerlaeota bacterium]